jgi:pyruvate kinase
MSIRLRKTKIVATLGLSAYGDNKLEKIIAAVDNVVRFNFSPGKLRRSLKSREQGK